MFFLEQKFPTDDPPQALAKTRNLLAELIELRIGKSQQLGRTECLDTGLVRPALDSIDSDDLAGQMESDDLLMAASVHEPGLQCSAPNQVQAFESVTDADQLLARANTASADDSIERLEHFSRQRRRHAQHMPAGRPAT